VHHAISRRIWKTLEEHPGLKGIYRVRDPRFELRAANEAAHRGYQKWHRELDNEVVQWLRGHREVSPAEFEKYLREIYERPEMRERFPWGFER
jgi:transposase-like protein